MILYIIILVIATEALTELITSSEISLIFKNKWKKYTYKKDEPPEDTLYQKFKIFVDKLLSCGYCSSVWVAGFLALFAPLIFDNVVVNWFVCTLLLHRSANLVHVLYELIRKGRVKTYDLLITTREENGTIGEGQGESPPEIE